MDIFPIHILQLNWMDSTKRFSNRVEDYVKYRPGYPQEIVAYLKDYYQLEPKQAIADIGAGTGISSALFLQSNYQVWAVEPNEEMRTKAAELLRNFPGLQVVNGTAEATGLPDNSMGAVIAGQAFHWFDVEKSKVEFLRILKPGGLVVLIWNERKTISAFETDYELLIKQYANGYIELGHRNIDMEHIAAFFDPEPVQLKIFSNQQVFDFEGLKGRLLSSSYMPTANDANYPAMIKDLQTLFDRYQENNTIRINYATKVYTGRF